jgi:hypothetical protein
MKCLALLAAAAYLSSAYADAPQWIAFDRAWPEDFIDSLSISSPSSGIVRFWERAGSRPQEAGHGKYPQYTLIEINCAQRTRRDLRWDLGLEDPMVPEALAQRSKFLKAMAKFLKEYPTPWESIEPNAHSYALHDFVCRAAGAK